MIARTILLVLWTAIAHGNWDLVSLDKDRPLYRAMVSKVAKLKCCYKVMGYAVEPTWVITVRRRNKANHTMETTNVDIDGQRVTRERANATEAGLPCHVLKLREVDLNDTGLYRCYINHSSLHAHIHSHGTFLQVYRPMRKFLDISESAKNQIITAEGVLLLLCVLVPGVLILCKTKRLSELDKKRKKEEEENIYEGLNLEDCNSTYDQIQRTQVQGTYQDVDNVQGQDIQLEKP
ncbi:hypothetical protein AAFF_G00125970 [Aldrovandia affinis]|uniref:Immunoglobulin domain-containing protein n=1 Tax=Aldrovandia affinis TaxID=143900 RepID=A0AAD7W9G0_9TELE|nr:hypothetical protein AAFF_G00125970 [Aldrovandia affinis]